MKLPRALKIAVVVVLIWSTTAFAVIPLVVHGAVLLASAALFAATVQAQSGGEAGRRLTAFMGRARAFAFEGGRGAPEDWGDGSHTSNYQLPPTVKTPVYAIPDGSQAGVELELKTPTSAVAAEMQSNPSLYPNYSASVRAATGAAGKNDESWGVGVNNFDDTQLPQVGDWINFPDGTMGKITSATCTGSGSSPSTIFQCRSGGSSTVKFTGQFQAPGRSGCNRSGGNFYVWSWCAPGAPSNPNSIACAIKYGISYSGAPAPTDANIAHAMEVNPAEVVDAQRKLYQAANGSAGTVAANGSFPAAAGGGEIVYPGTSEKPRIADIVGAVSSAAAAAAGTGSAEQDTDNPPPATTTTTTTTRTRGQAVVTTDADGTRTVTYPTYVTVTDADGNVVSRQTEYFVGTYPAGVALPADVQAAVDGVASSTTSEDSATTTPPLNLTKPELAQIDFTPLAKCADALRNKFPVSTLASITEFLDSFYVEPQTPECVVPIGGHDCVLSLSLLDNLAFWWRRLIKIIALAYAAWFAVHICMG